MVVRNVVLTDYPALTNMDWSPLTRPPTALFAYYVMDQSHVCLVAENYKNQLLGALVAYRSSNGKNIHLAAMKSLEAGVGVGRALVTTLQGICPRIGAERIWLFTTAGVRGFYEKMGFVVGALGIFQEAMVDGLMVMEWTSGHTE